MAEVVSAVLEIPPYEIEAIALDKPLECLNTSDAKSMLLQWNLDQTLVYKKFRFVGAFDGAAGDYDRVLKDFLSNSACMADLGGVTGNPAVPFKINMDELSTKVTSMDFFDRLNETDICHDGHIRGCFEDIFDGLNVADKLREMLVNEESENCYVYSDAEKKELIFVLFKMLAVGGSMCQPDNGTTRYLELTKSLYRDLLTVYKAPTDGAITVSGKVFAVHSVSGMELHANSEKPYNTLLLLVEPMRKEITVLKVDYKPFW